jgi:xanthine dehydrogenase small subunit
MFRSSVHLTVNGRPVELSGSDIFSPLSDILRYSLRKTGTKVVCAEGDCGACTVMLARARDRSSKQTNYYSINSCILPAFLADGCHIVTVEGLAQEGELHEIQNSMIRNFGGQCGFCTPGFVMSITNLFERKTSPNEQNIKNYLTGNLCRCTGYKPIIEAAKNVNPEKLKFIRDLYSSEKESEALEDHIKLPLRATSENKVLFAPTSLPQAAEFMSQHSNVRIFSGATDIGVQINKGKDPGQHQMSLHLIEELNHIKTDAKGRIHIGARVSLTRLQESLEKLIPAFANFLNIFASPQIKNSATLVGNLANGSPIADTTPFLLCMDAEIELLSIRGTERKPLVSFFKGYKQLDLSEDQFITGISFVLPKENDSLMALYKVSQRRDLDISCVNACFVFKTEGGKVKDAKISYGGVGPVPLRMQGIETQLIGTKLDRHFVDQGKKLITAEVQPQSDLRGDANFRQLMAGRLFERFTKEQLNL